MKKRIDSLTSLRFWMIIFIIASHFEYLSRYDIYNRFFHNRYVHVSLTFFFMISGFGLAYNYCKENEVSVKKSFGFAINKIKKLWVLYVVLLLVCVPYCIYLSMNSSHGLVQSVLTTLIKFIACLTLLQSATGISAISHGINAVSWFLSTLFILYLVTPMLLKINSKIKHTIKKDLLLILLNIVLMAIMYEVLIFVEQRTFFDDLSYGSPYIRVFAFVIGILIANIVKKVKFKNVKIINLCCVLIMVANIYWIMFSNILQISAVAKNVIELALCGMLIYICTFETGFLSKILSKKWNIKLGEITMYLYLIHYPVRLYIDWFFGNNLPRTLLFGVLETVLIILITFVISVLISNKRTKK